MGVLRFQASTTKEMKTAFFWVVTQGVVVILYQHFGTIYWSSLEGSRKLDQ